jgi:hypothetical protein
MTDKYNAREKRARRKAKVGRKKEKAREAIAKANSGKA